MKNFNDSIENGTRDLYALAQWLTQLLYRVIHYIKVHNQNICHQIRVTVHNVEIIVKLVYAFQENSLRHVCPSVRVEQLGSH